MIAPKEEEVFMAFAVGEKGKWNELVIELEKEVRANSIKPKGKKLTMSQLFKYFAEKHKTTASSTSYYYYDSVKPKIEGKPKGEKTEKKEKKKKEAKIIISVDESIEKFNESVKVDDIFKDLRKTHKIGTIIEATVISIVDFGVFVKSNAGFEGLIHISQIANTYVTMPEDYFYVGEKIRAKVVKYDGNKMNLSTRDIGGKERINPVLKELAEKKVSKPEPDKVKTKVVAKAEPVKAETKVEPKAETKVAPKVELKVETKVEPVKEKAVAMSEPKDELKIVTFKEMRPKTEILSNDRDNIIEFIKKYSDNNVSQSALRNIEDLINTYGVFQTTISLMETVRDLDISAFIAEMTRERLEGECLRRSRA
jgi:predicted RNA-binding protein with RPS1 domain